MHLYLIVQIFISNYKKKIILYHKYVNTIGQKMFEYNYEVYLYMIKRVFIFS